MMRTDPTAPAMRISGVSGALRVGYQVAATLGDWVVQLPSRVGVPDSTPRVFECCATVRDANAYWLARADEGFDLALVLGRSELLYRGVRADVRDGRLTATLTERPLVTEWAPIERT